MLQPVTRYSRLLLGANVVLAAFLLVGVTGMFLGRGRSRGAGEPLSEVFAKQAQSAAGVLRFELERLRQETRAAAELATHIFSNPESYRLAAQPGEYDYDQVTTLYGSVRNDGTSVVFLSAASVLNPEILREIRLSEYLNPIFKTSASLNPLGRSIALYTTDGLVRSYPWFDFKSRIASGALKRSFSVTELPFFAKAMSARNPLKEGVWELVNGGSQSGETQLACAAPFLAGGSFWGRWLASEASSRRARRTSCWALQLSPRVQFARLVADWSSVGLLRVAGRCLVNYRDATQPGRVAQETQRLVHRAVGPESAIGPDFCAPQRSARRTLSEV